MRLTGNEALQPESADVRLILRVDAAHCRAHKFQDYVPDWIGVNSIYIECPGPWSTPLLSLNRLWPAGRFGGKCNISCHRSLKRISCVDGTEKRVFKEIRRNTVEKVVDNYTLIGESALPAVLCKITDQKPCTRRKVRDLTVKNVMGL